MVEELSIKDEFLVSRQGKIVGHVQHALMFNEAISEVGLNCTMILQVFVMGIVEVEQSGHCMRREPGGVLEAAPKICSRSSSPKHETAHKGCFS